MQYKTICLQLLETNDQLRSKRKLLPALEQCANQLKARHEAWKALLSRQKRGSSESQIASEALELALRDMEECLSPASPPNGNEPLSLDAAMAFIRRHTPPA